jgi:NADPH:quinone reductase-like Zn-dependent oxidoreductase
VIDYHHHDWPAQVRAITAHRRVDAAANAVPGAARAIEAVADGGQLATITSDPPGQRRGITVSSIYVRPDGNQLRACDALHRRPATDPSRRQLPSRRCRLGTGPGNRRPRRWSRRPHALTRPRGEPANACAV